MKPILKQFLKYYLKYITKMVLLVHRPRIIAVAGSTNKSFVRDEIKKILLAEGRAVRANPKNFNTEIGLPLAILNLNSGYGSYHDWLPIMAAALAAVFQKNFPRYLVLELGVSQKGDMEYLLSIIRPDISVITDVTQRYIESFSGLDQMMAEYAYLVRHTKRSGRVILNYDNLQVRELGKRSGAAVEFFGQSVPDGKGAVIKKIEKTGEGLRVDISYAEKMESFKILRFGTHHAYAVAIGAVMRKNIQNG